MLRRCIVGVLAAAALVGSGCQNSIHSAPVVPASTDRAPRPLPPGPAVLDTVRPWKQPNIPGQLDWQLATASLPGPRELTWRVPFQWDADRRGRSSSRDGLVRATASTTRVAQDGLSLATYISQLANGQPIFSYTTKRGYAVFVTQREVSVAPSDPNAARSIFHSAVLDVNGRIIKLEIVYDAKLAWRFSELSRAILGTIEVQDTFG